MKVNYIGHSGFAIECDNGITLVFDFYEDKCGIMPSILHRSQRVYIFSSHRHPDHFNKAIFNWQSFSDTVFEYILSDDIYKKCKNEVFPSSTHIVHQGDTIALGDINVTVFGSTDIGVSFLVSVDGKQIFHAGDLNNWHWSEESTPQEIKSAEGNYIAILRKIRRVTPSMFLAMFPVDPRIGGDFSLGARQFLNTIEVENFIPMHQWGQYALSCQFELYKRNDMGAYYCMHDGESISI